MTTTGTTGILPQAPWFAWPDLHQLDPVLGLAAVMLIAVVAASALHQLLKLPRLAGYMLVGAAGQPAGLGPAAAGRPRRLEADHRPGHRRAGLRVGQSAAPALADRQPLAGRQLHARRPVAPRWRWARRWWRWARRCCRRCWRPWSRPVYLADHRHGHGARTAAARPGRRAAADDVRDQQHAGDAGAEAVAAAVAWPARARWPTTR